VTVYFCVLCVGQFMSCFAWSRGGASVLDMGTATRGELVIAGPAGEAAVRVCTGRGKS
jgi:hypothetical protein